MKNVLGQDGVLKAARPDEHVSLAPVKGSFYIELMDALKKKLNEKGDWIWLKNCLTDDVLMASEIETLTKRYLLNLSAVENLDVIILKHEIKHSNNFDIFFQNINRVSKVGTSKRAVYSHYDWES